MGIFGKNGLNIFSTTFSTSISCFPCNFEQVFTGWGRPLTARIYPQSSTKHLWFFHVLIPLHFNTSERELDYCHQNVNVRVSSRVAEQLKTGSYEMRKFQENPWNAWIWWWLPSRPHKRQILTIVLQNRKKATAKHSEFVYKLLTKITV